MQEIQIGEYIRTKQGYIGQYRKSKEGLDEFTDNEGTFFINIDDIVKHSKNIIDVIEVGDYVNGRKVKRIGDYEDFKRIDFEEYEDYIYEDDIKSIVTKEIMKSIEYIVK